MPAPHVNPWHPVGDILAQGGTVHTGDKKPVSQPKPKPQPKPGK